MAFTDHLEQPGQKSKATESLWWKTAIGHMQYILMTVRVGSLCRLGGGGVVFDFHPFLLCRTTS